VETLVIFI